MTSIVESTGVTIIISVLPTPLLVCELKPSSGGVVSVADGGGDVGVLSASLVIYLLNLVTNQNYLR